MQYIVSYHRHVSVAKQKALSHIKLYKIILFQLQIFCDLMCQLLNSL